MSRCRDIWLVREERHEGNESTERRGEQLSIELVGLVGTPVRCANGLMGTGEVASGSESVVPAVARAGGAGVAATDDARSSCRWVRTCSNWSMAARVLYMCSPPVRNPF